MLRDATRSLMRKPATEHYPAEREPTPHTLRGKLHWTPKGCTGCALCVKDCPTDAINLITIDKANKRFVMEYHVDRCIFCGQCLQSCRFDCLELARDEWELAAADPAEFTVYYGDPADVETAMADQPRDDTPVTISDK